MQRDSEGGVATAMNVGRQLCEALGLDDKRIVGLQLSVQAGQPVELVVTRYVTEGQGLAVVQLLTQRFKLVESAVPVVEPIKPAGSGPDALRP